MVEKRRLLLAKRKKMKLDRKIDTALFHQERVRALPQKSEKGQGWVLRAVKKSNWFRALARSQLCVKREKKKEEEKDIWDAKSSFCQVGESQWGEVNEKTGGRND